MLSGTVPAVPRSEIMAAAAAATAHTSASHLGGLLDDLDRPCCPGPGGRGTPDRVDVRASAVDLGRGPGAGNHRGRTGPAPAPAAQRIRSRPRTRSGGRSRRQEQIQHLGSPSQALAVTNCPKRGHMPTRTHADENERGLAPQQSVSIHSRDYSMSGDTVDTAQHRCAIPR
jgi:hypothetical protein